MCSVKRLAALGFAFVVVVGASSCASNGIDDSKSANVLLEVTQIPPVPPITTSGTGATCIFTQTAEIQVTMKNVAKNSLAQSPFSDIVLTQVLIDYTWSGAPAPPSRLIDPSGITVPVGGTAQLGVKPVALADLSPVGTYEGTSGVARLTIFGRTVDGYDVDPVQTSFEVALALCPL